MNIIYLRSNPVSPDPRVEKEVYSLLSNGHDVKILCWDRSGLLSERDKLNVQGKIVSVVRCSKKSTFGGGLNNIFSLIFFQIFLLRNLIGTRTKFDVVHAADFDTVLPGLLMKILFKKKLVYDIFDFYIDSFSVPNFLKPLIKKIDFFSINMSNAIILANESRAQQIRGSFPKRVYFIHNTPMEYKFTGDLYKNDEDAITIVYVGILQPGRLLSEIIKIIVNHPTWSLIIAGFGSLENEIKDISMRCKNIKFHGVVDYKRSLELSASADVLFATYDPSIPNHKYSSPNKLYEAMMLSKPIIVCKSTGVDEIVDRNLIGLSIGYDAKEFEGAVEYLVKNRDVMATMSLNSRALYENEYSWRVMEERLVGLYKEI